MGNTMELTKAKGGLHGEITVPGDKSVSHRAVMFGAIAEGTTEITHFLRGADCRSTISCFRKLGIAIEEEGEKILVHGKGLHGLRAPSSVLDVGNSGTTMRLLSGILAGQPFPSELTGDASVCKRPMGRILEPLRRMGARVESVHDDGCAPLRIRGGALLGTDYVSPVASAQVKSCVLLAGLYAEGETSVTEPALSRNHTEILLRAFGADLRCETHRHRVTVRPGPGLCGQKVCVPGDISSAAYFLAAALIVPGSEILIRRVGVNPTRDGILRVCKAMGADITRLNEDTSGGEPTADLLVRYTPALKGCVIEGDLIPSLIDEIPILAVLAAFAEGTTVIRDAAELRVKESDRLDSMVSRLSQMGADITGTEDGMVIRGGNRLHGADLDSGLDHRVAMSLAVAALAADGVTRIRDAQCVKISYPSFYRDLERLWETETNLDKKVEI